MRKPTGIELFFLLVVAFGFGMGVGLRMPKEVVRTTVSEAKLYFQHDGKLYELKEVDALDHKRLLVKKE